MNSMKDAMEEALKKRSAKGPVLNLKIEIEGNEEEDKKTGLAPGKLAPSSPHEDEEQDKALIDKKLAEAGITNDNDLAEEMQEEKDPELEAILMSRGEDSSREPRTLAERAAQEYRKNKKA